MNVYSKSDARVSRTTLAFFIIAVLAPSSELLKAQEAVDFFKQNCVSCHTIGGGRLTGPDLKNVSQRRDRGWLTRFLLDPKGMIDSGDPYALELMKEARGVIMPAIAGMNKPRAEAVLDLILAESKLAKSQFAGIQLSERPFTQQDIQVGRDIFLGAIALKNGGPPCFSCHAVQGIEGFGGGSLAPDLTTVFERYEGRKTLSTWLIAPATPAMQSVFKKHPLDPAEVLSLVAYFQSTLQRNPEDSSTARLSFILLGLGGTLLILGLFDVLWGKRFRAVRRPLIEAKKAEIIHE